MMNDWIGSMTDMYGLTDTGAQARGLEALNSGMRNANANLDTNISPVMAMYQKAMQGRDMGDVLDQYRNNMAGEIDAGTSDRVKEFLNPMYGRAVANATDSALAGAGSSALSTAGNNAVAQGVSNTVGNMWNQAYDQSMGNSQNNQGIYSQMEQSDLMPSLSWSQFTSDIAGSKYDADVAAVNAAAKTAGQNRGWFSSLFNGVLG
jgi:hypothetical protein